MAGKLAPNGSAYVTLTDGTTSTEATGAGSPVKAEDSGHVTGDPGTFILAVRNDGAGNSLSGSDADYTPIAVDARGRLFIVPRGLSASATFTPAASSHTAGDCNGAAGTFALGALAGSKIKINSVSLEIDSATIETTAWTLHLYNVTPPSALADDAAFDLPSGDRTAYLGSIAIAQVVDLGSTLWIESSNIGKQVKLDGTSLYGYLVNGTTLTPAAVAHIVTINAEIV